MAAQYRRSAQPRGYRPRTVDQSNISRMREDTNRTVQGMRQRAEMEINDRRRVLQQQKEDQAATRRMVEKNFQIETENTKNELRGLQLEAQQQAKQSAIDAEASAKIFKTISDLSVTAADVYSQVQENRKQKEFNKQSADASGDEGILEGLLIKKDAAATATAQLGAVQEFESKGGDPFIGAKAKAKNPNLLALRSLGQLDGFVTRGGFDSAVIQRNRQKEAALGDGRTLEYEDERATVAEVQTRLLEMLNQSGHSPKVIGSFIQKVNARAAALLSGYRREEQQVYDNQRLNNSLAIIQDSPSEDLPDNWSAAWANVVDYYKGDRRQAWQAVKPVFTAIDENGNFLRDMTDFDNLPLYTDEGETTAGEKFSNPKGQAVGIRREIIADRNRARVQFENQQEQAQKASNRKLADELGRAFLLNPTEKNGQEMVRMYTELSGGDSDADLNNLVKHLSIEGVHRAREFQRIAALPDYELTPELVASAKTLNPTEAKVIEERYKAGPGQFNTKAVQDLIKKGQTVITGTTSFGTAKLGKPGSIQAQLYFRSEVMNKSKLIYGNGTNGYTVEQAVAQAVQEESDLYTSTYRTEGSKYFRKVKRNGTISYPWIDARAGNTQAAAQASRDVAEIRGMVKEIGLIPVLNIPNSFMSPERMDYVAQNYGQPGFKPEPIEQSVQSFSAGMPLHEIYNRGFAAAGRKETFGPPVVLDAINLTAEQQRIINDARVSYQTKLNTINVASGNTEVYKSPTHMRAGSPFLIYTSGNIGPTSTGPHLDVKRVDGQEFAPNALDTFVEVEDPELGRVPLSKVPITGDFAEHKARGSHGIDYGLYSGTQVFAKNGAKVVDTQPSEHGDVVTIELPNGLRYTFLHGTAPK